jgi:hypothetical protein
VWARDEPATPYTQTELVAQKGDPTPPLVRMDGVGMVDTRIAHVPEMVEGVRAGNGTFEAATEADAKTPAG